MSDMPDPIRVRRYGQPGPHPPVVVLHGGPGAPGSAAGLARALGRAFEVLEPLQRRATPDQPLTVDQHVADLVAVAPPGAQLVGWSWGAMLALSYAALHPGRAASLALVGCGTYGVEDRAEYQRRIAANLGEAGLAEKARLKAAQAAAAPGPDQDAVLAELGALNTRAQAFDPLDDPDEQPGDHLDVDAEGHAQTWADAMARQRDGREPAAFAAVRAPALMLHGEHDPHPGRETCARLRDAGLTLEYLELPRCGHTPWQEREGRAPFLAALTRWLQGERGVGAEAAPG